MTSGWLYDGRSGVRHAVELRLEQAGIHLFHDGDPLETVSVSELSVTDRSASGLVLARAGQAGWRLKLAAPVPAEIEALFPPGGGYGRWIDRIGLWRAAAAFTAVSAMAVTIGFLAPAMLAPLVPQAVEKLYGDALVGDFGGKYCSSAAGERALRRLATRLDPRASELNIRVVDAPIVNAAALPAGNIVLFDRLFTAVQSPDELAGILAHEIAHVRKRHVTAALIREFGVGVFAATLGGTTGGRVDGFVALNFTRRAEQEADDDAIARLQRAGISPRPTSRFFAELGKLEGNGGRFGAAAVYLSSHPLSKDRERKFAGAARKGARYTPALTAEEWRAVRAICAPVRR
jgi:beta-barrel assembly-enhancing protease